MVNSTLPIQSVKDLIAYVKASPGKVNYSSPGNGSVSHLAMSELMRRAGEVTHVPYQGAASRSPTLPQARFRCRSTHRRCPAHFLAGGRCARSRSVHSNAFRYQRCRQSRRVAWPDFDLVPWVGLLAPAGTPGALVDKVSEELEIVRSPGLLASDRRHGRAAPIQHTCGIQDLRAC